MKNGFKHFYFYYIGLVASELSRSVKKTKTKTKTETEKKRKKIKKIKTKESRGRRPNCKPILGHLIKCLINYLINV